MSYTLKTGEKYSQSTKKFNHRPQYHFSSEVSVPPPIGFDVSRDSDEPGEAADLADDTYFYKQLKRVRAKNPKLIHSKLKNANIDKDVILYQSGIQRHPTKPSDDEYENDYGIESDEYVERDSDEPNADEDYDKIENPESDYEIIDEAPPIAGRRPIKPKRPNVPSVKPRDPTLAVINAGRGHRLIPGRRNPPVSSIPCNQNISTAHHRKTVTSTRESILKTTKKFHSPEELYAEIAKIIDRKRKNYKKPGHDKTHWELKIVPAQHDEVNRK